MMSTFGWPLAWAAFVIAGTLFALAPTLGRAGWRHRFDDSAEWVAVMAGAWAILGALYCFLAIRWWGQVTSPIGLPLGIEVGTRFRAGVERYGRARW